MKEGWEYKKLGEVCEILDSQRKPITKGKRESGSIPYYGATGLLDYVKDYIFDEKLVLLGEDGAKWGAGEKSAYIIFGKSWVNNHAHALRPKRNIINDEMLIYYLNYADLMPFITGVTVPKLNQARMREIIIPVPSLQEQQAIVSRLDTTFAKIDALKANAEKQLNDARALFQAEVSESMMPKEGWEEKMLVNEFSLKSGENLSAKNQVKGPYPVYGGNGITGYHNQYNLSGDQILIGRVGALCGNIHYIKEKIWVTDNAFVVNNISSSWNMHFLSYELEYIDLNQYASQTAQPVISNKSMKDVSIFQPPLSEQQQIVAHLDALSAKVKELEKINEQTQKECDALKEAMLREIFE